MFSILRVVALALAALLPMKVAAQSPAAPADECVLPPPMQGHMPWFNGFTPSDDLLTAWCRIQTLSGGKLRFNVQFPTTGVHRSWDTSFEGGKLPPGRIVDLVQSLLPTKDGQAADDKGMEFHRVLLNVIQAGAKATPDGTVLGFPSSHPTSREAILWEPLILRVKPVVLAGQEFVLRVVLKPNLGMLALGLQGRATDVRLLGWKDRMETGNRFTGSCSSNFPYCRNLPDVVSFHAPWVVAGLTLEAYGENLTQSAIQILQHLGITHSAYMTGRNPLAGFNQATGSGTLTLNDASTLVRLVARGGAGGTKSIVITFEENKTPRTVRAYLERMLDEYRNGTAERKKAPEAPDSLDRMRP